MRKLSVKEAAITFGKEWLVPQLGTASAVFTLTNIGLSSDTKTNPVAAFAPYLKIVEGAGSIWAMLGLGGCAIAIIAVLVVKLFFSNKAPAPWLHRFMAARSWYHTGVGAILGTLLVPLAVSFAALVHLGSPLTGYVSFISLAVAYIVVAFALYWLKLEETTDSFGNVYWVINSQSGQEESIARKLLTNHFDPLHMLGECEVTSNSNDGTSVLEVPVLYALKTWEEEKIKTFELLFKKSGDLLKSHKFNVIYRGKSFSVEKGFKSLEKKGRKK